LRARNPRYYVALGDSLADGAASPPGHRPRLAVAQHQLPAPERRRGHQLSQSRAIARAFEEVIAPLPK
jgi:hypothetical protein